MPSIRVASWNVNARRDCAAQVAALAAFAPDVIALQEVTAGSDLRFPPLLAEAGLTHYVSGAALAAGSEAPVAKRYSALASRFPLEAELVPVPRPELAIAARVATHEGPVRVLGVHIPTWSNGREAKLLTQEGVCSHVAGCDGPTILMGDFNSPKDELEDGTVVAFTRPKDVRGKAAELALLAPALADGPLFDCFRAANGWTVTEGSWFWKNRGRTGGFRLDHIFASSHFRAERCWYAHDLRLTGMSDHSPIVAELELAAGSR